MAQLTMANENRGLSYHHGSLVYTELNSRVGVFHCILYTPHQKKEMEYLFSTFKYASCTVSFTCLCVPDFTYVHI